MRFNDIWWRWTTSGVHGDPTTPTADKGQVIFEAVVAHLIALVDEWRTWPIDERQDQHSGPVQRRSSGDAQHEVPTWHPQPDCTIEVRSAKGMRIRDVRAVGLRGKSPAGGWSNEIRPDDCVHTLIAVLTDAGLTGIGSVFTSDALVRAALKVLEPLYLGEHALEPERVSEKLHQHTFWQGRGGAITHTISGIDIALWDILGRATDQPVGRLLGGRYRERVQP